MSRLAFNPAAVAETLVTTWRKGDLLTALPAELRPDTLEQGYDAQDAFFQLSAGERAGWKLGVGSPAAMRTANISRPLIGQLDKSRIYGSGVHLDLPALSPLTIECEIAFVLDKDLPPLPGREIDPTDIRTTCVTFEVVHSRFVDRKAVGWPSFVADNVGFEALIVGELLCEGIDRAALHTLAETAVVLLDGQPKATGLFGDVATDPFASLNALYQHAAERGITLKAGDIVSTGAMCQPFDITGAGHQLSVSYFGKTLSFTF